MLGQMNRSQISLTVPLFIYIYINSTELPEFLTVIAEQRKQVPFRKVTENMELVHECSPEHLCMGIYIYTPIHTRTQNAHTH